LLPDARVFTGLRQVREETRRWLYKYDTVRPHEPSRDISPMEFLNDRGHVEFTTSDRTWSGAVHRDAQTSTGVGDFFDRSGTESADRWVLGVGRRPGKLWKLRFHRQTTFESPEVSAAVYRSCPIIQAVRDDGFGSLMSEQIQKFCVLSDHPGLRLDGRIL